ncbi:hypothetical protein A9Q81_17160 [Gammaproteobacteria bacterium 42_54_T18]|nr:hypothetical protein A9Q81_17160 [Gammaproteobacteria bacterium 42_54_T18]
MELTKYKELIVEHWVTAMVTGVFGLVIGLSVTAFESKASDNRFFLEKQAVTADRVALSFSIYVENWRRIIKLKEYVKLTKSPPTESQISQLKTYVEQRDRARDKLFSALDALHLYFAEQTSNLAVEFRLWDESQSTKTTSQLASIAEWQKREIIILVAMRKELLK